MVSIERQTLKPLLIRNEMQECRKQKLYIKNQNQRERCEKQKGRDEIQGKKHLGTASLPAC
jgi:hypothetical protein